MNALVRAGYNETYVVLERPVPRKQFLRTRMKRVGVLRTFSQALFVVLIQPLIKRVSRARIAEIIEVYNLEEHRPEGLSIHVVESANSGDAVAALIASEPDIVLVNGTRILKGNVLSSVSVPFVNIHTGITPKYRGVHGGYWAVRNGDDQNCGVTVHLVDEGIDTGGILFQAPIERSVRDSFVTYPILQYAAALPRLVGLLDNFQPGQPLQTFERDDLPSKQWYHPTIFEYLWTLITSRVA